jgi:hypothetical protein
MLFEETFDNRYIQSMLTELLGQSKEGGGGRKRGEENEKMKKKKKV